MSQTVAQISPYISYQHAEPANSPFMSAVIAITIIVVGIAGIWIYRVIKKGL